MNRSQEPGVRAELCHEEAIRAGEHDALAGADPRALLRALEGSDRFHRDTPLGGIFHRGKISFREKTPTDSLHIVIHGDRISAHVDHVSPLRFRDDGTSCYSLARVLAHNLSGARADLRRFLGGVRGRQRCRMVCDVVWMDDDEALVETEGSADEAPATA